MACSCHGWAVMLHALLSWWCTIRQTTKSYCWSYADLDVFTSGKDFSFPVSIMIFQNIVIYLPLSQPSHFLPSVHASWLRKVLEVAWLFPLHMFSSGKKPKKSPQSQQIEHLFWGLCWQPSSLNWESLHHIPLISLHIVMLDGFNHPGYCVSGESAQVMYQPPKKVWKSKALLFALQLYSKHA